MNHDTIKEWFTNHPITPLNIFVVAMILTEKSKNNNKLSFSKSLYQEVVQILSADSKISTFEKVELLDSFEEMDHNGLVDDFSTIICSVTNNPNLINHKWVSDNTIGQIKNSCFPCKAKSKRKQ